MGFLLTFIFLSIFWISLSGSFEPFFIIIGFMSCMLVAYLTHDLLFPGDIKKPILIMLRIVRHLPWFAWQVLLSNIHVARLSIDPKKPINPQFITFKVDLKTDTGVMILANAITLTPGTVTVGAQHERFIVHAISNVTAEGLAEGEMQTRVKEIER